MILVFARREAFFTCFRSLARFPSKVQWFAIYWMLWFKLKTSWHLYINCILVISHGRKDILRLMDGKIYTLMKAGFTINILNNVLCIFIQFYFNSHFKVYLCPKSDLTFLPNVKLQPYGISEKTCRKDPWQRMKIDISAVGLTMNILIHVLWEQCH